MVKRRSKHDPYYRCELHCNHDLGRGMSIAELIDAPAATRHPTRTETGFDDSPIRVEARPGLLSQSPAAVGS